ncbi:MAG: hypothetical protein KF858_00075 [Candidatus Sumerlaeia bacterium]|nr:hypothetical protein [Candidatus Sumerlaeia bacterium]
MRSPAAALMSAILVLSPGAFATAQPIVRVLPDEQMRIDVAGTTVQAGPEGWELVLPMQRDNDGAFSGPGNRAQWWHFELSRLDPAGERLVLHLTNASYRDNAMPVASINGGPYERHPGITRPVRADRGSNTWTFAVDVPPGTESLKIARYYPYTFPMFERFRTWYNDPAHERFLGEEVIGHSVQGRPIHMVTLTDRAVPDDAKQRAWVHSAVHAGETTAFFCGEGLIEFLLSDDPFARAILERAIVNVVPMANPDGVALANHRTNALGLNIEDYYYEPWDSDVPEPMALRRKIEVFMGTADNVGSNPIRILLNLHAADGVSYPFHYIHQGTWLQPGDPGVKPSIHALERRWIALLKARSPFVALGTYDRNSTLERTDNPDYPRRPFVEAMMHDRYSIHDAWDDIMAITFEGTYYETGPRPGEPATEEDYREVGRALGRAIGDYLGIAEPEPAAGWTVQ